MNVHSSFVLDTAVYTLHGRGYFQAQTRPPKMPLIKLRTLDHISGTANPHLLYVHISKGRLKQIFADVLRAKVFFPFL